ncbi:hypothetical protein [Streptomyces sp. NPDC001450]
MAVLAVSSLVGGLAGSPTMLLMPAYRALLDRFPHLRDQQQPADHGPDGRRDR